MCTRRVGRAPEWRRPRRCAQGVVRRLRWWSGAFRRFPRSACLPFQAEWESAECHAAPDGIAQRHADPQRRVGTRPAAQLYARYSPLRPFLPVACLALGKADTRARQATETNRRWNVHAPRLGAHRNGADPRRCVPGVVTRHRCRSGAFRRFPRSACLPFQAEGESAECPAAPTDPLRPRIRSAHAPVTAAVRVAASDTRPTKRPRRKIPRGLIRPAVAALAQPAAGGAAGAGAAAVSSFSFQRRATSVRPGALTASNAVRASASLPTRELAMPAPSGRRPGLRRRPWPRPSGSHPPRWHSRPR